MASPPFNITATDPQDTDYISTYPTTEQTFRDIVNSWLSTISDSTDGSVKVSALGNLLSTSNTWTARQVFDLANEGITLKSQNNTTGPTFIRFRGADETPLSYIGHVTTNDTLAIGSNVGGNVSLSTSATIVFSGGDYSVSNTANFRSAISVPGLTGGNTFSGTQIYTGQIRGNSGSFSSPTYSFADSSNTGMFQSATTVYIASGGALAASFTNSLCQLTGAYNSTTSDAANVAATTGGYIRRSTSARKYKANIKPVETEILRRALMLDGISYNSRASADDPRKRHFGIVADQAHEIGLTELVFYGEDGEVEGFKYERAIALLLEIVKRHEKALKSLV